MKRIFLSLLSLLLPLSALAQGPARGGSYSFTTATTSPVIDIANSNINLHGIRWTSNLTPSACTVNIQGSNNQSTWTTISSTLTCTSSGTSQFYSSYYAYMRINVASLTIPSGGILTVNYLGYIAAPTGTSVTDTSTDPLQIMGSSVMFPNLSTTLVTQGTPTGLYTVSTSPGILASVTVGVKSTELLSRTICYDAVSTATTTPNVFTLDTTNMLGTVVFGRRLLNGLVCSVTGSSTVIINYK